MVEVMNGIGSRIEAIRKDLNFSRAQFGKLIGVSGQYVGMIERGGQSLSVNVIMSICKKTGASADYILFGRADHAAEPGAPRGLRPEQVPQRYLPFDLLGRTSAPANMADGNERMIQEVFRQQNYFSELGITACG